MRRRREAHLIEQYGLLPLLRRKGGVHPKLTTITEFDTTSGVPIKTLTANASGAGKIVQTGYETTINGVSFSLQKIEIQAKDGKMG